MMTAAALAPALRASALVVATLGSVLLDGAMMIGYGGVDGAEKEMMDAATYSSRLRDSWGTVAGVSCGFA